MNRISFLSILFSVILLSSCKEEHKGNISGKIEGLANQPIYLELLSVKSTQVIDSAFTDSEGSFGLLAPEDSLCFLELVIGKTKERIRLIKDQKELIEISATSDSIIPSYHVKGSKESALLMTLNKDLYNQRMIEQQISDEYNEAKNNGEGQEVFKALNSRYTVAKIKHEQKLKSFANENPGALSSIIALAAFDPLEESELFQNVSTNLQQTYPNTSYANHFQNLVAKEHHLLNQKAPEINLPNVDGDSLLLTENLGKFTLLEFWATWSGSYIQEIHFEKMLYKKYADQGLEIYSVCLDQDSTNWINTVKNLNLKWVNVHDESEMNTVYKDIYQLEKLPTTFLINEEGVVIDKYLRGRKLELKLIELFGY